MRLLSWRLLTLLLAALSMALSFCHLMEMPVRLSWPPELWIQTTTFGGLYALFGRVGAVIDVSAVAAAAVLVVLTRSRPLPRRLSAAGALLLAGGLGLWFAVVAPMNAVMAGWVPGPIPDGFDSVRSQWELGHVAIALVKLAALAALLLSVLVETDGRAGAFNRGR